MEFVALAILTIGTAFVFAYIASLFDKAEHGWLKVFFVFFSLFALMVSSNIGINFIESVNSTYNASILEPLTRRFELQYTLQLLAVIFSSAYFFIYLLVKLTQGLTQRKKDKENEI
jgi:hypothetical protein